MRIYGHEYQETYSVFTVTVLVLCEILIVLLATLYVESLVLYLTFEVKWPDNDRTIFSIMWYPDYMYNCDKSPDNGKFWLFVEPGVWTYCRIIESLLFAFSDSVCEFILVIQAYEWLSMLFLIDWQLGK